MSDLYAASFVRKASIDALVAVQLHDRNVTDFVEAREISVEGILRIDPNLDKGQERSQLVHLYRLEDAQILQIHERTSMREKGTLVRPVSAEKPQDAALEYRAAFLHGDYDLGRGRTLRIRSIDRQQQSLIIEWPSDDPSQVYSWSMTPEAPHGVDFRMSPETPWGQTTGWGVVWHTDSDTVWIADGTQRKKLNIAEPTTIKITDSEYDASIEQVFREHLGLLAWHPSPDERKQITLLWPKGALAKAKEHQEEFEADQVDKRLPEVKFESAKLKKIRN